MATVLVTCVGSGVGQSVIDSLNLKREFKIIGCDGNANVYAHSYCDQFIVVPSLYSEGYTDFILNLCLENNVDILIPGHDHELVMFGEEYDRFRSNGIEVIVSTPEIIAISRDKQRWFDYFEPLGCRIVPTISVGEFLDQPDESILPAIVKPSGGSASQGISIINDLDELVGLNVDDIIQPYLFPEETDKNYQNIYNAVKKGNFLQMSEISIQLTFNKDAKFSGIFISKNSLKSGVPVFVDPLNPDTFEYTEEILKFVPILESNGVRGPVNIQGRVTPNGLLFFEMNMRFTGITGNRALLGYNEVDYLVRDFLGYECELNNYAYNKVGVRQVACTTIPRQGNLQEKETLTVLGAGSNIGRTFVFEMSNQYKQLNLVVRKESLSRYKDLFGTIGNIRLIIEDDIRLHQVLCQSDALINFVSALAYEPDKKKYDAIRFIHRISVLIAKTKIPKIVNISSQSVYNQSLNEPKTENHELSYDTSYSFQKVIIEDLFSSINDFSPLSKVVSLRLPRVIAPDVDGQPGFFGKMIKEYQNGNTVNIEYPQNNTNLIHVDDVVSSINFVLKNMEKLDLPSVLNVSGENISMEKYASLIKSQISGDGQFIFGTGLEVKSSSMIDGKKLNDLGWTTKYKINDIITLIS